MRSPWEPPRGLKIGLTEAFKLLGFDPKWNFCGLSRLAAPPAPSQSPSARPHENKSFPLACSSPSSSPAATRCVGWARLRQIPLHGWRRGRALPAASRQPRGLHPRGAEDAGAVGQAAHREQDQESRRSPVPRALRPYRDPWRRTDHLQGMQDQNAESIKSLEAYNIAWCEEAQTLSNRSLASHHPRRRLGDLVQLEPAPQVGCG